MKKILIIIILIVFLGIVSYFLIFKSMKNTTDKNPAKSPAVINRVKIAMIIAFKDFKDEEYFIPRKIFEDAGAEIKVVSNEFGAALGADGGEVNIDIKLTELNVSEFDAIVFIGGPGALDNLDNGDSYKIVKDAVSQNKILAAICISPIILAKAGVLQGKKATVWTSPLDKQSKKVLEDNGAKYQDKNVVVEGNIITANGPGAAKEFGNEIIHMLST